MTEEEQQEYYDNKLKGRQMQEYEHIYTFGNRRHNTIRLSWTHGGGGSTNWGIADVIDSLNNHRWKFIPDKPESYQIF